MKTKKKNKVFGIFDVIEFKVMIMMFFISFLINFIWNAYYSAYFLFGGAMLIVITKIFISLEGNNE